MWQEQLTGLTVTNAQFAFAHPAPRNHKQFMLFNFSGCCLALVLAVCTFAQRDPSAFGLPFPIRMTELMAGEFWQLLADFAKNHAKIQPIRNSRGIPGYSCKESMRDVCGDDCVVWSICPTAAFDKRLVVRPDDKHSEAQAAV
jgi:hypothetical protein